MFAHVNYRVEIDLLEDARAQLVRSEVAMRFIDTKLASGKEEEGFDEGMTNRLDHFIIFFALLMFQTRNFNTVVIHNESTSFIN